MSPLSGYLVETFVTLVAVVALAVLVLYGARRLGAGRGSGPIRLVGVLPLEARRSIYLVRVADNVIIVGVSEAGMTRLGQIPAASLPAEDSPPTPQFGRVLERFSKGAAKASEEAASPGESS